jgi:hypothetical protein
VIRETSHVKRQTYAWNCSLLLLVICLTIAPRAHAFKITEPADGATLTAGQTVVAHVNLGNDIGIVKVRYYWYGEQDDTLVEQEDTTATGSIIAPVALVGLSDHDPAFGGKLLVPKEGIGPMRLLAVAEISRGRLGTRSVFDEVIVNVEPKAALTTIDFETDKPLQLGRSGQSSAFGHVDSMGKVFELPVVGDFADGVTRRISSPATGTSYQRSSKYSPAACCKLWVTEKRRSQSQIAANRPNSMWTSTSMKSRMNRQWLMREPAKP